MTEYGVDEDDGSVTVEVQVLQGSLSADVEVELTTRDGSATSSGERENMFLTFCFNLLISSSH